MSDPTIDALQEDIERTRDHLADTVDELSAKFDVRTRVREATVQPDGRPKPAVLAVAGALAAAVVAMVVIRVRRGR